MKKILLFFGLLITVRAQAHLVYGSHEHIASPGGHVVQEFALEPYKLPNV